MLCLSGFELYSRWVPLIRELKQQGRRRLRKHHLTLLGYSISFTQTMANFSGVEFQKNCIEDQENLKKVVFLCSRPRQNVKLATFTS